MKPRLPQHIKWLFILVALLFLLNVVGFIILLNREVHHIYNNYSTAQPEDGINGADGYTPTKGIDYFDGVDGRDSRDGRDGRDGKDGEDGNDGAQGPKGDTGQQGTPGDPGASGREIEIRHNDEKDRTEWRYVGDPNWQLLMKDCEINDTCI